MANVSSSNGLEKYPKLRFKGFSEPWNAIRFGDIVDEYSDRTKEENEDILLSAAIEGMFLNSELFDHQRGASNKGYKKIDMGTLVLSTQNLHLGNANVNLRFEHGMVSPAYKTYHIHDCSIGLIAEWVKSEKAKRFFYDATTVGASVCRRNVEWDTLYDQSLYLPSEAEQERLATFLTALTTRIKKQTELVEHLKKYKRGAITLILSNKDGSWKSGRLGDFITINRGGSPRPIEAFITNDPDGVNWIKIGDVSEDSLYITQTAEKITAEGSRKSRKVFAGDLILSNSMSFGRPYIMQIEGCIHDGWLLLRDDGACFDKKYLCYYLASDEVLAQYKKYAAGSCVSNLNSELVSNVFIEFPPLEKQKEIASSLELLDERINCEIKLLEKLLLIKKGLLQSLFI